MSIFYCSDHHFGHSGMLEFVDYDGKPIRSFENIDEMNDTIIYNHNSVVKKSDTVYFLGDVAMDLPWLSLLGRMNGKKKLVKGNHDIFHINHYLKYFEDILGTATFVDEFILSHIPLHTDCITTRFKTNVHGHLHTNTVKNNDVRDPNYFCVCMEQINYTPIEHDELTIKIKERKNEAII